jgi:hypothetical protein
LLRVSTVNRRRKIKEREKRRWAAGSAGPVVGGWAGWKKNGSRGKREKKTRWVRKEEAGPQLG